ncbi:Fatty acyl-CoA reductase 2 [Pleodorina starrii]|nr:Fatty acyl-CoA reductase 2 [Pleodorina starrii]
MSCFKAAQPAAIPAPPPTLSALSTESNAPSVSSRVHDEAGGPVSADGNGVGAVPRVANGAIPSLSVREALAGKAILITGATGYLGGVVLEQILRVAGDTVGSVYVLSRTRGGRGARERVGRVIGSGLFDLVRRQYADTLRKIVVLDGDLSYPGLGLSEGALAELAAEPSLLVIHSAASIALEDPIQVTLRNNYEGSRRLLELVERRLPRCAGFVHVSTSFVGMSLPHNSCVPERLMPLMFGDQRVDHARLARELLSVDKEQADRRAALLCKNWNLPNTYLLGKHLTEALVEQYHREGRITGGACIVRPSLVSAIAGAPYPGYVGNLAGPSGYMTAFALGFFNDDSAAWHGWHLLDSVPGDVAAAVIVGAAACLASGIRSREALHELSAAATAAAGPAALRGGAAGSEDEDAGGMRFLERANESFRLLRDREEVEREMHRRMHGPREGPGHEAEMLVFHAATSTVNPCMHFEAYQYAYRFFTVHTPKWRLGGYVQGPYTYEPVPWKVNFKKRITGVKVAMAASLLGCFGQDKAARRLRAGYKAWFYANDIRHDKTLFFSIRNVLALERLLVPEERQVVPLVWRKSWIEYGNTYMAGVCRLFMGLPVPPSTPQLPHHFVYIPFVIMQENQLPPLAGTRGAAAVAAAAAALPAPTNGRRAERIVEEEAEGEGEQAAARVVMAPGGKLAAAPAGAVLPTLTPTPAAATLPQKTFAVAVPQQLELTSL